MVSALCGSGGSASHCKGSQVLDYHDDYEYVCSVCNKELIIKETWFGRKLVETGRIRPVPKNRSHMRRERSASELLHPDE